MTYGGDYGGQQPPSGPRRPRGPREHQRAQTLPLPGRSQPQDRPQARRPVQSGPPDQGPPRRQPPPPPGYPPKPRRRIGPGKILGSLLVVILLMIGGMWIYLETSINRIDALPDYEGRPASAEGTNWLIVGSDSRAGLDPEDEARLATGDTGGQRTDTIMIAHLPDNDTAPTLLSLPRDSDVKIPGHGTNKINAAFSFGGAPLLTQTVEQATGLRMDHYAEIGFGGFASIVDAVGGVEMDIPSEMVDTKTGVTIPAGVQELDGAQALGFVRMRYSEATPRSDLDRVANQRKFIGALVSEISSPGTLLNPFDLFPLLSSAPDALTMDTDDHLHNLVAFAWAMRGISSGGVVTTTMPTTSSSAEKWDKERSAQLFEALQKDTPLPDDVIVN